MAGTGNKKSFTIKAVNSKSLSFILSVFDFAATLLFRINNKIKITFVMSILQKLSPTINLKRVRLIFSNVKLIGSQIQTINLKKIKFTFSIREILKASTTIKILQTISFVSKAIQKTSTTLNLKRIAISFIPTLATFFTLSVYDPQTLSSLDGKILSDMDYIIDSSYFLLENGDYLLLENGDRLILG